MWNVGTMTDPSNEVAEGISGRKVGICSVQEVRWIVVSARFVEEKNSRCKMVWVRNEKSVWCWDFNGRKMSGGSSTNVDFLWGKNLIKVILCLIFPHGMQIT